MRLPGESIDEYYVRERLERSGLSFRKVPESKVEGQKSPDFEVFEGETLLAVAEVKTLERVELSEKNGYRLKDGFWSKKDNAPSRVGRAIHAGWGQLGTYPDPILKLLVFVNDVGNIDVVDLQEAFHGFLDYGSDEVGYFQNLAARKIASGAIKNEKDKIDIYVWFDRVYGSGRHTVSFPAGRAPVEEFRTEGPSYRVTSARGEAFVRRYWHTPETDDPSDASGSENAAL